MALKGYVALSNLRKRHVTLPNLGVYGHSSYTLPGIRYRYLVEAICPN